MASYGGEKQSLGLIYIFSPSVFSSLLLSRLSFHFDLPPLNSDILPLVEFAVDSYSDLPNKTLLSLATADFDGDYDLRRRCAELNLASTNSLRIK